MKTKTTLAALLLAAVMVTPSYGATEVFLKGAEHYRLNFKSNWWTGHFLGFCKGLHAGNLYEIPSGADYGQVCDVVARYVYLHPEHRHLSEIELVKRACKEAWPNENKHVFISK